MEKSLPHSPKDTTHTLASGNSSNRIDRRGSFYHPLQQVQNMLRERLLADPALCQTQMFRACLPFLGFVTTFVAGIILPRHPTTKTYITNYVRDPKNHTPDLTYAFLILCVGVLMSLLLLRAAVCAVIKIGISICEMDLNFEPVSPGKRHDERVEFSQGNLLVGGLFA